MEKWLMASLIFLIPLFIATGCVTTNLRCPGQTLQQFLDQENDLDVVFINKIWLKVKEIEGVDRSVRLPLISILKEDPDPQSLKEICFGYTFIDSVLDHGSTVERLVGVRIEIYSGNFLKDKSINNQQTLKTYFHNTIGHELDHYARYLKNQDLGHCAMLKDGNFNKILDFIDEHFQDGGKAKKLSLANLKSAYERELCEKQYSPP